MENKKHFKIWNKIIGNTSRGIDYAGREIVKSAYGDEKSKYGWNIDHILPKSKDGKNNTENLIVAHILTNQEKGDNFSEFSANGKKFKILKKENGEWKIKEI
ncbi:HNH endonuclease [Mesomycoplasma molare]|uniref:HNH endonuclease n=1 Tax=Mesomycoplasma molare TaxID=171288 RepID=A0ABY5TWD2_9BACT|nr:HNH endonuclease signature motif containing protein [Mesomycoplasma molare]UWD33896.1 HNH endonuclease [Mesomycoplasma molare]